MERKGYLSQVSNLSRKILQELRDGVVTPESARVQAQLLRSEVTSLKLRLEHAKLTGRLTSGSDEMPDVSYDVDG